MVVRQACKCGVLISFFLKGMRVVKDIFLIIAIRVKNRRVRQVVFVRSIGNAIFRALLSGTRPNRDSEFLLVRQQLEY